MNKPSNHIKNIFSIAFLLLTTFTVASQEVLFDSEIELKSGFLDKRETLPIVNDQNNEIALFLLDNKKISGLRLNSNYELIDKIITQRPKNKFRNLLGHSIDPNGYYLFFTNKKKSEFFVQGIDVNKRNGTGKQIALKLKGEKFLETISYKNKFYLLTVKKRTSFLKIYTFEGNKLVHTADLDFGSERFSNAKYYRLFDVLLDSNNSTFDLDLKIHKIENGNPNPLDITTKDHKLYYYDDKIFISLDDDNDQTRLITVNLNDFNSKIDLFIQPNVDCQNDYKKQSNSYLLNNNLYQIKGCKERLMMQITDITNGKVLKQYGVNREEEISFTNTPLMQEGSMTFIGQGTERELKRTRQVLRKLSASDIGISVRQSNENIEMTIGGFKEVQVSHYGGSGGFSIGPAFTTTTGGSSITYSAYHFNPTMYGYSSYTNTRSVYFKSLIDSKTFAHKDGEVQMNAFDKIKEFENDKPSKIVSETIFKTSNYYVFGYYDKKEDKYYLIKFENEHIQPES